MGSPHAIFGAKYTAHGCRTAAVALAQSNRVRPYCAGTCDVAQRPRAQPSEAVCRGAGLMDRRGGVVRMSKWMRMRSAWREAR
jgi:hypothetical protein